MANNKSSRVLLPSSISEISFNSADTSFVVKQKNNLRAWIEMVLKAEGKTLGSLSYTFCSDSYLRNINRKHLQHNYFTDIITFDFCEGNRISGDIYISIDRIRENAKAERCLVTTETHRVMIHGVIHLCGYNDKTLKQQHLMRAKEDKYLSLLA
jgi:probable rRNA maturation factor